MGSPCHFNLHFPDDSFVLAEVGSHSVGQIDLKFTAWPRLDSNSQKTLLFTSWVLGLQVCATTLT